METPFVNDLFAITYMAFKNICPDKNVRIQWNTEIEPIDGEQLSGITRFAKDGTIIDIEILANQSVAEACETLTHELAHAIVGPIQEHGKEFQDAYDALVKEYIRILDEKFTDCITLEVSVPEETN